MARSATRSLSLLICRVKRPTAFHGWLERPPIETGFDCRHIGRGRMAAMAPIAGISATAFNGSATHRLALMIQQYQGQGIVTDVGCFRIKLDAQLERPSPIGRLEG